VPLRTGSSRRLRTVSPALLAVAALAAVPALAPAATPERPSSSGVTASRAVPNRLIVVWEPDATRPQRASARDDADATLVRTLGDPRFQLLRPQAGQSVSDALATLRDDPAVRSATRDTYDVLHATTNDPLFGQLWGLQNVGLGVDGFAGAVAGVDVGVLAAWDRTRGSSSVVIADLDSGYRFDAPDLGPVAWSNPADPQDGADNDGNGIVDDSHGADFVGSEADAPAIDGDPTDDDLIDGGHGVHTAGTMGAAGNNGVGISGVAQDVRIMPLRVCSFSSASEETRCPSSSQILGINYAGAHGARAANMSLGGTSDNTAVRDALAVNPNTLFVISAGNDAEDNESVPHYPCNYDPSTSGIARAVDNVVCVAAIDQADGLADFSDFGAASVDLGAPGTEILSTYPATTTEFTDDFETNNFATNWRAAGADGGFARTNEAPLTSFGMSDTPGGAPRPGSVIASTSTAVAIPALDGACVFVQTRHVTVSVGGFYQYQVLSDGSPVLTSGRLATSGTITAGPIGDVAGTRLQVTVLYSAGPSPQPGDGVWLDDLRFDCNAPLTTPPGYDFLDGTSMAAPHVTGAAGLLFSLNPSASVAQARGALLTTVHPTTALAGKTVTGGRLDAAAALDEIRQPDTAITSGPAGTTASTRATFAFTRADALIGASFECQLDGAAFSACSSPASYAVAGGRHTFAVRAKSPHGILTDPSPATAAWTVQQCRVPRLKGKSLRRAKRALRAAHCALGRVKRPRARRGRRLGRLVVTASRPRAGAIRPSGASVKLTLGKPKSRHARHRRHGRGRR
jgi:thermitase